MYILKYINIYFNPVELTEFGVIEMKTQNC